MALFNNDEKLQQSCKENLELHTINFKLCDIVRVIWYCAVIVRIKKCEKNLGVILKLCSTLEHIEKLCEYLEFLLKVIFGLFLTIVVVVVL